MKALEFANRQNWFFFGNVTNDCRCIIAGNNFTIKYLFECHICFYFLELQIFHQKLLQPLTIKMTPSAGKKTHFCIKNICSGIKIKFVLSLYVMIFQLQFCLLFSQEKIFQVIHLMYECLVLSQWFFLTLQHILKLIQRLERALFAYSEMVANSKIWFKASKIAGLEKN